MSPTFAAIYLGSSGWIVQLGDRRVLIDPWLRGTLSFSPGPWLIEGRLDKDLEIPQNIDLLLLTQGLPDHCHPQSLQYLSKNIPVIGSASAAKIVRELGFQDVIQLKPGENIKCKDILVSASSGALVPNIENGYILNHISGSLYVEPHGFLDENIQNQHIDAVITPVVNLGLPIIGNFIKGKTNLTNIINKFEPYTILASTTGGDAVFTGLVNRLMVVDGSTLEAANKFPEIFLIDPIPGHPYSLITNKKNI